jgi:hypothetical protein
MALQGFLFMCQIIFKKYCGKDSLKRRTVETHRRDALQCVSSINMILEKERTQGYF